MVEQTRNIFKIIPKSEQWIIPLFIFISFLNILLDILSIAILVPFILLILDTDQATSFFLTHFQLAYDVKYLPVALILLLIFFVMKNLFQTYLIHRQSNLVYAIASKISKDLIQGYLYGSLSSHVSFDKANLMRDFQKIPISFCTHVLLPVFVVFSELIFLTSLILVGLYVNFELTLGVVAISFLGFLSIILWRKKKTKDFNRTLAAYFLKEMQEILHIVFGFLEIKSTKTENVFTRKFEKANIKHNQKVAELTTFKQSNHRYFEIVVVSFVVFLLLYLKVASKVDLSLLSVSIFASVFLKLLPSVNKILTNVLEMNANYYAVGILSSYPHKKESNVELPDEFISLDLKDATFKYQENTIFQNLNLEIRKGNFMYISGASGIGKTTLLKVISGLYPLQEGSIKLNNLKLCKESCFLPFVGLVPQKSFLFKASLKENITMFDQKPLDEKWMNTLLEVLELVDFVRQLSNGLETIIDVDTMQISGGQKQRIAILRALYAKPKLLVLDESTNQLNEALERKIIAFFSLLVKQGDMTIVVASHQPAFREYCTHQFHLS